MEAHTQDGSDAFAARSANVIAHLDGALQPEMLDAMAGVWTTLERAATDGRAHARAVRSRMFWETLADRDAPAVAGRVDAGYEAEAA